MSLPPQQTVEPRTGMDFPGSYCCNRTHQCPTLTGLGVRAKRVLGIKNINVYALGMYIEADAAKKALHKYRTLPHEELQKSDNLYEDIITSTTFDRTLRIVMSTDLVTRDKFISALNERLVPELKKEGEPQTLAIFEKQFADVKLKKGTEIVFYQSARGSVITKVDGEQKGAIQSPALSRALLRIYLGADPVSPGAKEDFGANLAKMLKE